MKNTYFFLALLFLLPGIIMSQETQSPEVDSKASCESSCACASHRADDFAPIGIMNDHNHSKKGFMVSYRYMNMKMADNLSGSTNISNADIYQTYMLAPQEMSMQMHMLGVMYGVSDKVTLMAMTNYQQNQMSMTMMDGMSHDHEMAGLGDVKVSATVGIWKTETQTLLASAGISLPTGNISKTEMSDFHHFAHGHNGGDPMPSVFPYPMRTGSGTFDALLNVTYIKKFNRISLGTQMGGTARTGRNERGYRLGNNAYLNAWGSYRINDWLSLSLRGEGTTAREIKGADQGLMPMMSPTNHVANSGGEWINGFAGANVFIPNIWKGMFFGAEYGLPVYQQVNGVQMTRKGSLNAGLRVNIF